VQQHTATHTNGNETQVWGYLTHVQLTNHMRIESNCQESKSYALLHEILNDQENAIELVHRVQLKCPGFLGVQYWLCHYRLHSLRSSSKERDSTISSRLMIHKSHRKRLDLSKEKWSRGLNIANMACLGQFVAQ